jgi:hypothetical protein
VETINLIARFQRVDASITAKDIYVAELLPNVPIE